MFCCFVYFFVCKCCVIFIVLTSELLLNIYYALSTEILVRIYILNYYVLSLEMSHASQLNSYLPEMTTTKNTWEDRKKNWELPQQMVWDSSSQSIGAFALWPVGWPSRLGHMPGWYHLGSTGNASQFSYSFPLRDIKGILWGCISIVLQSSLGRKDFNLLTISTQLFHPLYLQ